MKLKDYEVNYALFIEQIIEEGDYELIKDDINYEDYNRISYQLIELPKEEPSLSFIGSAFLVGILIASAIIYYVG